MKQILYLAFILINAIVMAQSKYIDKKWKEIDKEFTNGQFKSVQPKLNIIKDLSLKENNQLSYLKALFYESRIRIVTSDEKNDVNFIFELLKNELKGKSQIYDAIINSYLAKLYILYFNENRWKIESRTNVDNQSTKDIRFWTEQTFHKTIKEYFEKSIFPKRELLASNSSDYKDILDVSNDPKNVNKLLDLTPSMYDVLVSEYVNYLKSENNLEKINDLYTDLVLINQIKNNLNAALFNELNLLNSKKSTLSLIEFIKQKELLAKKYASTWYSASVYLSLATDLYEIKENKLNNINQIFNIQLTIKNSFPNFSEIKEINDLVEKIKSKEFSVDAEKYISANKNTPIKISHKNIDKIYVKVLAYNVDFSNDSGQEEFYLYNDIEKAQKFLDNLNAVQDYTINLKSFEDYQFHSTVVKLNPLASGRYIVLFSSSPNFKISKKEDISYLDVSVSDYALNYLNGKISVVNRTTGKPEKDISVEILNNTNYQSKERKIFISNKCGEVLVPIHWKSFSYRVKDENAIYTLPYYPYYDDKSIGNGNIDSSNIVKIFTDRKIYRPGQMVYFKVIYYKSKNNERSVIPNKKIKIILNDVNRKEISKVELTTNEFGSVYGDFATPISGLTGIFEIEVFDEYNKIGSCYINVEEYKRPKFQVEIDNNKKKYNLNDKVTVEGKAVAFSALNIINAKVNYRVYREEILIFRSWHPITTNKTQRKEISFGETTTDGEGKFFFDFIAKPSLEDANNKSRIYSYSIEVSVTDINGETQSTSTTMKIGDTKMIVNINLEDKTNVEELKSFTLEVKNLNDENLKSKGHLDIYSLNVPKEIVRRQKFITDYNFYSKGEFRKLFPNEPYGNEMDPKEWKTNKKVFEVDFDTSISNEIDFSSSNDLEEGYYLLRSFALDGSANRVDIERLIYIFNEKKSNLASTILSVSQDKNSYEPKEIAKIDFRSGSKDTYVYYEIEANQKIIEKGFLEIDKMSRIEIPIKDEYLGGINLNYVMTKFNDIKFGSLTLAVPCTNKDLKITTEVINDKLTPGFKDKWQLKIWGVDKDKFSAEVLAAMYDISLDQFASNSFDFKAYNINNLHKNYHYYLENFYSTNTSNKIYYENGYNLYSNIYTALNLNLFNFTFNQNRMNSRVMLAKSAVPMLNEDESSGEFHDSRLESYSSEDSSISENELQSKNVLINRDTFINNVSDEKLNNVQSRRNLNETAFFFPNLKTDAEGNVILEFTAPESLTEWKFLVLAHTRDLKTGYLEKKIRTQKELMVVPNMPRFLRQGDKVSISSKINTLSTKELRGSAKLMLFDAFTNQPIDLKFNLTNAIQEFTVKNDKSTQVTWTIDVPKNVSTVTYRIVASTGAFSDGEESIIPILSNRMLVTETLPIYIREGQSKILKLDHLINNKSNSLENFKLTFEMASNPIWYAVFSLPYLREFSYECSEQVFARLYGNIVSERIISSNPKIKAVFDDWGKKGNLNSRLELNKELKNIVLEETPWLRNSEHEGEQKRQIAALFQLNQMQNELKSAFQKLLDIQQSDGSFPWFNGGKPNKLITTYIVSGFGNLKEMGVNFDDFDIDANSLIKKSIQFIDKEYLKHYNVHKRTFKNLISTDILNYLYARSFFLNESPFPKELAEMINIVLKELKENKLDLSLQEKAMAAIVMNRFGMRLEAKTILNSIKEKAVLSDEMGMYWKENQVGWYWYQAPVETQALLIEAFDEVLKDEKSIEEMKVWLLKNRQTNQWSSTKATTKAVYALMNFGKSWIDTESGIRVKVGNKELDLLNKEEVNTSYAKTTWYREEIKPNMGKVEVSKSSKGITWGALYWQYFEDLDKIKSSEKKIHLTKKLFLKQNSINGSILKQITPQTPIRVGDLVTVRLEISIDRPMQFIHIKDMRASGLEPLNVFSGYTWKGEFGCYESISDTATNFFIDYLNKGTYVFEYDLRATNVGNFSNGITSLQNMYAPELTSQSEGIRIDIK